MGKKSLMPRDPFEGFDWIKETKQEEQVTMNIKNKPEVEQTLNTMDKDSLFKTIINEDQNPTKTSQTGLPQGWTRATFIVQESTLNKIKDLAYTERKQMKKIIDEALQSFTEGKEIIQRQ
jgi:hypothetical protein